MIEWMAEKTANVMVVMLCLFTFCVLLPGALAVALGVILHLVGVYHCDTLYCG